MKALLTGAGGFCGRHLMSYLEKQGVEVHTLSSRTFGESPRHHVIDLNNVSAMTSALVSVQPDYVFHLAGISHASDPALFYQVNTQYAVRLLYAMEQASLGDRPALLVGTSAEYGLVSAEQLPIREDLQPRPYNHYGISKLAQTLEGLSAAGKGRHVVVVRPFNIIGAGMPEHLALQSFARQVAEIKKGLIPPVIEVGNLESSRDFIDVHDSTEIYWRLVRTPSAWGEVINVCSGRETNIGYLLSRLVDMAGISIEVRTNPSRFKQIDVKSHYGSVEKMRRVLGIMPMTSLDASLESVLKDSERGCKKR